MYIADEIPIMYIGAKGFCPVILSISPMITMIDTVMNSIRYPSSFHLSLLMFFSFTLYFKFFKIVFW